MVAYNELDLLEDIKAVLTGDDNYRIKIACIESYFNVYESLLRKDKRQNDQEGS